MNGVEIAARRRYMTIYARRCEQQRAGRCAHSEESATDILMLATLMLLNDAAAQAVSARARSGAHGLEKLWAIF